MAQGAGAYAQPKGATDEARELAREGWKALDEGKYAEALEKVTKAEGLYHAPIHLLLLGNAQVGLGRLADAIETFERLAAEPLPADAPKAFREAQETGRKRVKELIARVPSLLVEIANTEAVGATVTIDGKPAALNGIAVRLNPGEHTVAAEAAGYETASQKVTLPEKGGVVRLPIVLVKKASEGGPPSSGSATGAASASAGAAGGAGAGATGAASAGAGAGGGTPDSASRVASYVVLGAAGVGLAVGAATGGLSLSMTNELKDVCPGNLCPPSERGKLDAASTLAAASTASFVVGGVAAAAGLVLLVVDLRSGGGASSGTGGARAGKARAGARGSGGVVIEPWISAGGAGLRGRF
ncbi:MAG: PEGA domain-containing protein [Polyangiaceae bacterium]